MSYGVRKQKIIKEFEVDIISCCECGMQFALFGAIIQDDNQVHLINQIDIDYCPYCGKK